MVSQIYLKTYLIKSIFLLGMGCTVAAGRTIYVDDDGSADFNNIQAAIDDSNDGDTVIVADGIYTGDGNRDIEFGHGLPAWQTRAITVRSENGPENCIIDCNWEQGHRAFYFRGLEEANSVLDGFTIVNGYKARGGGINCTFSSPTITNCWIIANDAGRGRSGYGGGIFCSEASPTIINCTLSGNSAVGGGGIFFANSNPTIDPTVTNCILWDNSDGGGTDESAQINYITMPVVNYCCIQGLTGALGGTGNIGDDPCFADPCNGDYHLKSQAGRWDPNSQTWVQDDVTSPCIDAGDPISPIGLEPFPNGGIINMGAYGGTAEASKSYFGQPLCETIVAGDINGDCKVNFLDFRIMAFHWLRDENQ